MNRKLTYILLAALLCAIGFASCKDDFPYDPVVIGEGNANINATVSFHPLVSSLDETSRAAGDAIKTINDIQVVIYNSKGQFFKSMKLNEAEHNLRIDHQSNTQMPNESKDPEYKNNQAEERTDSASFTLRDIPFGKYYMYVVANYSVDITEEIAPTPDDLLNLRASWNEDNISKDAQMFGCLSTDRQMDYDDQAPELIINRNTVNLHAWIKRLASKVTVVFDGSGLHQGIYVYVNKVTIRDIPKSCSFRSGNKPDSRDSLIYSGDSLFFTNSGEVTATPNPEATNTELASKYWMPVSKDDSALGAVVKDADGNVAVGADGKPITHPENALALYFYENCQGDYSDDRNKDWYDKRQKPDSVGTNLKPGDPDWKDNVPYGTYIEVEAYYSANYDGYVSYGPIKYRFMLGQDVTYNYNASRNRHYKVTLGFKGYANQPDWHIVYDELNPGLYPPERFYVSYLYNTRHEMPIRLTGAPTKVDVQIIENNWAPYDPNSESEVPAGDSGGADPLRFQWNKTVYDGKNTANNNAWGKNGDGETGGQLDRSLGFEGTYYYGLHNLSEYTTKTNNSNYIEYNPPVVINKAADKSIPEWVNEKVTPIWVGFLALQVPSGYESEAVKLPTGIRNVSGTDFYRKEITIQGLRDYYLGNGKDSETKNDIQLYQNTYNIPEFVGSSVTTKPSGRNDDQTGRNAFTVVRNEDESITINVPLYTQPKALGFITGFSGNNPYEAYRRKAVLKITAEYKVPGGTQKLVKYVPVYQMRRMVNPKAIWRTYNDTDPFHVKLMVQEDANATTFTNLESEGEWQAWVASDGDDYRPASGGTFTISGGDGIKDGKIYGNTGSKIAFTINFAGVGEGEVKCGKIMIKYHGLSCEHSIYVRQGYNTAVRIGNDANDKKWSSFSVYSYKENVPPAMTYKVESYPYWIDGKQYTEYWNNITLPEHNINGLGAEMTVNPLALGTMFKRGNYLEGIRIINNKTYGPLSAPGVLQLTNLATGKMWDNICGVPYLLALLRENVKWNRDYEASKTKYRNWQWSPFTADMFGAKRKYDIPTVDDYTVLMQQGFGVGVMYADGAKETATDVDKAFGYFNDGNNESQRRSEYGMRGIIVYNLTNHNQIFFPVGYSGIGRRTIQGVTSGTDRGTLRYGAVADLLTVGNIYNQFRPICYNLPASPGAIYWAKGVGKDQCLSMDMNYFDLSFNPYDYATSFANFGDAIPIKPIYLGIDN